MQKFKAFLHHVFIDGLSGMALGLFATLIVGTILAQLASAIPGAVGGAAERNERVVAGLGGDEPVESQTLGADGRLPGRQPIPRRVVVVDPHRATP